MPSHQESFGSELTTLTEHLQEERGTRALPSLSVAVARDQDVVRSYTLGTADLETEEPATPKTIYRIGSITKLFTVTMYLQMVDAGKVDPDDPLSMHLPEYQVNSPFPDAGPTTLRQLAAHTAGLPRDAAINFPANVATMRWVQSGGQVPMTWYASKDALLKSLPTVELVHRPNTGKHYSNLGMALLGIAMERVAGQPFEAYVREHILAPLGMHDSGFTLSSDQKEREAKGYVYTAPDQPVTAPPWELGAATYTGGLYATAADLARFLIPFLNDGDPLMSESSYRLMCPPASQGDAYLGWGHSWMADQPVISHSGGHLGFLANVIAVPRLRLGLVVMTNRYNPMMLGQDACLDINRKLLERLAPVAHAPSKAPFDPEAVNLALYTGTYTLPGGYATIHVTVEDSGLYAEIEGLPESKLACVPVGPLQFAMADDPSRFPILAFDADETGAITGAHFALFDFNRTS